MAGSRWDWLNAVSRIILLVKVKERAKFRQENLRSARCSPSVFSKVLAARNTNLITARARKNKLTARMLTNARKDHSIPPHMIETYISGRTKTGK